ncbi:MAG: Pyridoxamine 5'-phosphate oxidase [candidate division NC10 bacterium]|nr:Pyridoxamine 5'-phosphate oxidase [candidate division NC10 bacterium]
MNRHAYPTDVPETPPVPEPTYAERARTLVYLGRIGTLSTLSRKHPGQPFGSVMPYSLDAQGRPLFLISTMAMHTQNLQADPRASLLVTQPSWTGDPLAAGRVTLMGEARPLTEADAALARQAYLARHSNAAYWVDFEDFSFYRLEIADIYFVGGFAAMDWVSADEYLAARPDPLADTAAGIIEHMNHDHADALITFARVLAGTESDEAVMISVDRLGFKLRLKSGPRLSGARIPFPREVTTTEQCRAVLIEMLRDARHRTST